MRGKNPDSGEFHAPSRSQQRREALDVLALGERLATLSDAQLARLPLPEDVLPHVREARSIKAHGARKRQLAFLAKQLRREDDQVLDAIRDALDETGEPARLEAGALHRAEAWRERLLEEGDSALSELLVAHPGADPQRLRQLVRNALDERRRNKPPHAFRELFRELRGVLEPAAGDAELEP